MVFLSVVIMNEREIVRDASAFDTCQKGIDEHAVRIRKEVC